MRVSRGIEGSIPVWFVVIGVYTTFCFMAFECEVLVVVVVGVVLV